MVAISIWSGILLWALALALVLEGRSFGWARLFWSAGALAFGLHVVASFEVHYQWSHGVAIEETARQTAEVAGLRTGAGLWFNYLFGLAWWADAAFWWSRGHSAYFARRRWIGRSLHGFMAFMIFNGAVVFVEGTGRWLGAAVFVGLAAWWARARIFRPGTSSNDDGS